MRDAGRNEIPRGPPYADSAMPFNEDGRPRIPFNCVRDVNFFIVGGCLTYSAAEPLKQLASVYGIRATVEFTWAGRLERSTCERIDVLVYQPSIDFFTGSLWNSAPFLSDEECANRLRSMEEHLSLSLTEVKRQARGGLLLVQGFSVPTHTPYGHTEFRLLQNYYTFVFRMNDVILRAIRDDPDAMFVDEERLLSAMGKLRLLDHLVAPIGHHGSLGVWPRIPNAPSVEAAFGATQSCNAPQLFAQAYLDSYVVWSGIGRIKCVIVDQDNVLWNGVAGDSEFELGLDSIVPFAGIHQALKFLSARGIFLATCSRNNATDSQDAWERLEAITLEYAATDVYLHRGDFVIQKVNWADKSTNIAQIAAALGLSMESILFIDDSAAEREEVRAVFPHIRTLGENMNLVRAFLLTDPCLQVNTLTSESSARTEMVKAQLERDAAGYETSDESAFLANLNVHLKVTRIRRTERLARIVELIQRTNQFNTTLARLNAAEVREYVEDPHRCVYVLEAADRFAAYGLVGACLLSRNEITVFVLSCRVIPLKSEVPFLSVVLQWRNQTPISGAIIAGPRNVPCRQLYHDAGFEESEPGRFVLRDLQQLRSVDASTYRIECIDEEES